VTAIVDYRCRERPAWSDPKRIGSPATEPDG
jgi:hypothetical protein